ncbi:MAG: flagellar motor switch protein FliG, partial [Candidatus Cloacimonadota bacterium]|nr:flagellar motor switch protein FliG [Candidatus Cloacimonadota bacterium]
TKKANEVEENVEEQDDQEKKEPLANVSGIQKTAILMISIGKEASSKMFNQLEPEIMEEVSTNIAQVGTVDPKVRQAVLEEFYSMIKAQEYVSLGGIDFARDLLNDSLGGMRAMEIIKKIQRSMQVRGFNVLKQVDSTQLLTFIQKEHPQTIALVLTQLEPTQAANVIDKLPEELRNDVIIRFATMERVSQDMIDAVEEVLEDRIDFSSTGTQFGGVKAAAEIINQLGTSVERSILDTLSAKNPELANEIKNLMFVFEDIVYLEDRTIQAILKEVDQKQLTLALKGTSEEVTHKVFKNMSERAASMIEEEMSFAGPVRLKEVEDARQKLMDVIRKLEEMGEITLTKGGEDFVQ